MRAMIWFRSDLRVSDNIALSRACKAAKKGVVGLFLIADQQWKQHDWGASKVDFVLRQVAELSRKLASINIPLVIRHVPLFKDAARHVLKLMAQHGCESLYFNREYEVNEASRDKSVITAVEAGGMAAWVFEDQVVVPPTAITTGSGGFYKVYTPFRKAWIAHVSAQEMAQEYKRPAKQKSLPISSDDVPVPYPGYTASPINPQLWPAGEQEANRRLKQFMAHATEYKNHRDAPAIDGTSSLSPYLACGVISSRQCLHAALIANGGQWDGGNVGLQTWIYQLIWREFYRHVMVGFPRVSMGKPFKLETERVAWLNDAAHFQSWCEGRTGVPFVDAGMRQLRDTGWMHNRLRMVVAMYLTKNLLIDWRWGERFFMQHLVDGDLANNNGGWQWAASTGTDAVPYFRVFNPVMQSRRFDPQGCFIRKYCPELANLSDRDIHDPPAACRSALGYPKPLVDLAMSRRRAIAAFTLR